MKKSRAKRQKQNNKLRVKDEEEYQSLKGSKKKSNSYENEDLKSKYYKIIKRLSFINIILVVIIVVLIISVKKQKNKRDLLKEENPTNSSQINSTGSQNNETNGGGEIRKQRQIETSDELQFFDDINVVSSGSVYYDYGKMKFRQPAEKRKIYVKYMDFWPAFVLSRFDVHRILLERYEVIESDNPDYVIFGEFGGQNYGMENKFNCVKLFLSIENRDPNFGNTDYAIGIHYINNGDRYFRKPTEVHQLTAIHSVYNVTQVKGQDIKKKKFCAWVVSNGSAQARNSFFERLSKYKQVDSGGSYMNNVGGPVDDKLEFLSHYKFSICFENSKTPGYISEKLSDSFEAGTIPIYYGDDTVLEILNNRSYIHVKDESEFDEKIELIKKIDQNDTLYEEVIREKIVIDDSRYPKEVQKYKNFIYHIIEQDKEKAKRFKRSKES